MQLFILGKTKSGKSTLARTMDALGFNIYEAGAWARREFKEQYPDLELDEMSPVFKERLTRFAQDKLKQNPYYSLEQYEHYKLNHLYTNTAVVGVRNPDDFINMLRMDKENKIIFIQSDKQHTGSLVQFESGLDVIQRYLEWRETNGMPISVLFVYETDLTAVPNLETFVKDKS